MDGRDLARNYAAGRIGIGVLLMLFPGRVLQGLLGGRDAITPGIKVVGRMVGARDAILGAGALAAMQRGRDSSEGGGDGPLGAGRPWMTYGAAADAADALAILLSYRHLGARHRFLVLVMAAAGAATGGYLSTASEQPKPAPS